MEAPVCSVCIANYNGIGVLEACIASLRAQTCRFAFEIIVHDDASTDGSVAYLRSEHPDIVLLANQHNAGFCISNNRMVDLARGSFVLLLNNDAELFPDALQTLHDAAQSLGRPAILSLPQYDAQTGRLIDIGCRFDPFLNPVPNLTPDGRAVGAVSGACFWLQRSLWHELGGFPDWFGSLAEDTYLCCAARLTGHLVAALPHSGFRHWVGTSLGGGKVVDNRLRSTLTRRSATERNKTDVMVLTYPAPFLQILLPLHLLLLLAEGLALSLWKRNRRIFSSIYLAALRSLWARRADLRRRRTALQAARRIGRRAYFSVFQWLPHKLSLLFSHGMPELR